MHQADKKSDRFVSELFIYPVKSLGGISLQQSSVHKKGLEFDRRWMLVDAVGNFLTQRTMPELSLFRLEIDQNGFIISNKSHSIHLSLDHSDVPIRACVWDDWVEVFEVSTHHSQWFSEMLGMPCRLVFFPEENSRHVDPDYALDNEQTSLSDGFPILIIGQASLDELNERLAEPVQFNRFRPNIVFSGGDPFEEDRWHEFQIGDTYLACVKPCARCVMTTINQSTAIKGPEPLAALSVFRRNGNKVLFGQNVLVRQEGSIAVGDAIRLL